MTHPYLIAASVVAGVNLVAILVAYWGAARRMRNTVFSNLDNAARNDHFEPGEYLYDASPDEIAYDLTLHADDCGEYAAPELTPYVRQWLRKRGWAWHT